MEHHFATVYESLADSIGDTDAIVGSELCLTWHDFDDRASRLAGTFGEAGVHMGSKVATYLYNSAEYLETVYATLKSRAVPVNINYRYLDDELAYLLNNSQSRVLVYHRSLGPWLCRVVDRCPDVHLYIEVDDDPDLEGVPGALSYLEAVAADLAPRIVRDEGDLLFIYTGGTTGMPKGVMLPLGPVTREGLRLYGPFAGVSTDDLEALPHSVAKAVDEGRQLRTFIAPPLMHGTGLASALGTLGIGGAVILDCGHGFSPERTLRLVTDHEATALVLVGDPFARPLIDSLEQIRSAAPPLRTVRVISSAGAVLSKESKIRLFAHLPDGAVIVDVLASSEAVMGIQLSTKATVDGTAKFMPLPGVKVVNDTGDEVAAGSGETGMLAVPGAATLGYFNDAQKTEQTMRMIDGVRHVIPGDWATVEVDGSLTLLGRGSHCINTGGEKVFPEEVEETLKTYSEVTDALVFGVPDDKFGQRIEAIVSLTIGADVSPSTLISHVRERLASYKAPKRVTIVGATPRFDNGKPDYSTARSMSADSPLQVAK